MITSQHLSLACPLAITSDVMQQALSKGITQTRNITQRNATQRRHHAGITQAPRKHHASTRKHHASTTQAPRRHHAGIMQASRRHHAGIYTSQGTTQHYNYMGSRTSCNTILITPKTTTNFYSFSLHTGMSILFTCGNLSFP